MKSRVWVGLAVVPLLLLGGAFYARKAAWERLENSYRRDLVAHAVRYSGVPGVAVMFSHREGRREQTHILTGWSQSELKTAASDMHLVRWMPGERPFEYANSLQFVGPPYVFIVSLAQDRGEFIQAGTRSNYELGTVALSPDTCRALKKRVWAQCSDKLRQFHISPPQ